LQLFAGAGTAHGQGSETGQPASNSIETLVITGAAPYGYHPWKSNIEKIEPRLKAFGYDEMDYLIAQGLEDWRKWDGDFREYDAVVIIYYWSQAPPKMLETLDQYLCEGGALIVAHSALAGFWKQSRFDAWTGIAYRERADEYGYSLAFDESGERILRLPGEGRGSGHRPIEPFKVRTRRPDHPIMQGLPKVWLQPEDEVYYNLRGPHTKVRVLATAKAREGVYAPQAWVRRHGNGRVFCITPGHHGPGASSVGFITLLARGIEWAASGKVTLPVPANFPGKDEARTGLPRFGEDRP
jgi:hypothetical protein